MQIRMNVCSIVEYVFQRMFCSNVLLLLVFDNRQRHIHNIDIFNVWLYNNNRVQCDCFFVVAQMQQVAWLIFTHRVTHYGILALFSSILANISYVFFFSSYFLFCAFAFLIFELLFDCRLPVCLVAMHCDK